MASRRDELNAYTFAKRRLLAAFLQPSPSGTEEGAPKPLRTVVPSLVAGALTLAVFGAWGMFQPTAPSGWDEPGARVIVGKQSTTRYVVLKTDGDTRLHPVLNLASARLLMKDGTYEVVQVGDDVLDSGEIPRGPILGIPYAPDRLPAPERGRPGQTLGRLRTARRQGGDGSGGYVRPRFAGGGEDGGRRSTEGRRHPVRGHPHGRAVPGRRRGKLLPCHRHRVRCAHHRTRGLSQAAARHQRVARDAPSG